MNLSYEIDGRIQNEHAVRCSITSKPVCVLEYIKSISSLVGASHILAVFEESDAIKVFFDEKRHVDTLIKSCLHVMGRHVHVEYVVPPGTKLILSNVDPVITNFDIMRLLTVYGTIVSPVIRPPFSDDIELCHIGYGVRFVYMEVNGGIPERLEFKYGDQFCYIKIRTVDDSFPLMLPYIKSDDMEVNPDEVESDSTTHSGDTLPGPSGIDSIPVQEAIDPILVSVQSVPECNDKEQIESLNQKVITKSCENEESVVNKRKVASSKRRRGRPPVPRRKRITLASRAAKRIKENVKHKWMRRYTRNSHKKTNSSLFKNATRNRTNSLSSSGTLPDLIKYDEENISKPCDITNGVLEKKQLLLYLDEVKGHRAPLELAKKYIGDSCNVRKLHKFVDQLKEYKKNQEDINLKSRIFRLIKSIKDSLYSESLSL